MFVYESYTCVMGFEPPAACLIGGSQYGLVGAGLVWWEWIQEGGGWEQLAAWSLLSLT